MKTDRTHFKPQENIITVKLNTMITKIFLKKFNRYLFKYKTNIETTAIKNMKLASYGE